MCRNALDRLREHFAIEGRATWIDIFVAYRLAEEKQPSQKSLGNKFDLTRDEVRGVLEKVEKRYKGLLRAELRAEGVEEENINEEIRRVLRLLDV